MVEKAKSKKSKNTAAKKTASKIALKKAAAKKEIMEKIAKQAEEIKQEAVALEVATENEVAQETTEAPKEEKAAPIVIDDTANTEDFVVKMKMENGVVCDVEEVKPSCGSILKEKRLEKNVSIKEISSSLMIKSSYLEALEDDNMDEIPGKTYVYGYIRAYANYLGLDDNELINIYKDSISETSEETKEEIVERQYQNIEKNGLYMKMLFLVLGVLAFTSLSLYGYNMYTQKKADEAREAMNEKILQDLMSEEDNLIEAMNQEAMLEGGIEVQEGEVLPTEEGIETSEEVVTDEATITPEETKEEATPISSVRRDIQMIATGSVWIKLKEGGKYEYSHVEKMDIGGGNDVFETLLRKGENSQLPTLEENKVYYLTIGNIENTKVILNGQELELREAKQTAIFNIRLDTTKDIKEQLKRRI
ncbi:MAG: helix-turn-helix domain-containing protein [Alphaproteobacteria bacterium]|nr:helix-turn-helix domain-containing protein [Alphaproteobacteria bacterium]